MNRGRSGGAMVLGKLPVPGRPANLDYCCKGLLCLQYVRVGVVWTFSLVLSLVSLFFLPLSGRRLEID